MATQRQQRRDYGPSDERLRLRALTSQMTPSEHAAWMRERALAMLRSEGIGPGLQSMIHDYDVTTLGRLEGPYKPQSVSRIINEACAALMLNNKDRAYWLIIEGTAACLHREVLDRYADARNRAIARRRAAWLLEHGRLTEIPSAMCGERGYRVRGLSMGDNDPWDLLDSKDASGLTLIERGDVEVIRAVVDKALAPPQELSYLDFMRCWLIDQTTDDTSMNMALDHFIRERCKAPQPCNAAELHDEACSAAESDHLEAWITELSWDHGDRTIEDFWRRR